MTRRNRLSRVAVCVALLALIVSPAPASAQDLRPTFLDTADLPAGMVLVGDARSEGADPLDAAFARHGGVAAGHTVHVGPLGLDAEVRLVDARARFPTPAAARAYIEARAAAIGGDVLRSREPLGDAAEGRAAPSAAAPTRVTWLVASGVMVAEVSGSTQPDSPPIDAPALETLARRALARIVASRPAAPVAAPPRRPPKADERAWWPRKGARPPREGVDHGPRLELTLRGLVPDDDATSGSFGGTFGVNAFGITHAPVGLAVDYDLAGGVDSQGSFLVEGRGMLGPGLRLGPIALAPMLGIGLDTLGGGSDDAFDMEVAASWLIEGRARISLGSFGVEGNASRSARGAPSREAEDVPRILRAVGRVFVLLDRGDEISAGFSVTDYGAATAWGGLASWSP